MRRRRWSGVKLAILVMVGVFVAFVGVRMATCDASLQMTATYSAPVPVVFPEMELGDGSSFAVVVNGEVVLKSGDTPVRPIASTAKTILALAVMRQKPFSAGETGAKIVINQDFYERYAWYLGHNGSVTAVEVGEEISQYDALVSVLLASSNNMADSLAIWAFGSLAEYSDYANKMVKEMGAANTTVGEDASGYSESTTSDAADMALIAAELMKEPVLAEIVGLKSAVVPVALQLENTNKLLGERGIVGVKTGYGGESSGYCLITAYREGDDVVTVALLGAPTRSDSFADSLEVVSAVQAQLVPEVVVSEGAEVGYYDSWWTGRVPIVARGELSELVYKEPTAELKMDGAEGALIVGVGDDRREVPVALRSEFGAEGEIMLEPSLWQRFLHVFGWSKQR